MLVPLPMRKALLLATISLSFLAACRGGIGSGPEMLLKPAVQEPEASSTIITGKDGIGVLTYQMGPYDLPAQTPSSAMSGSPAKLNFSVDEPIWVTGFKTILEDTDGNPLPTRLIQQVILINHGEENSSCNTKETGNPFMAATAGMEEISLPEGYGYPLMASDPLEARVILKNPFERAYSDVSVKIVLEGIRVSDGGDMKDVRPVMLDVDPCDHQPLSLAPGEFMEKTGSSNSPEKGKVIRGYGLLQDFGVSVKVANGGGAFWDGIAQINESYEIVEMPYFESADGISVGKGDKLELTVAYNNSSDEWFNDATASAIIYIARDDDEVVTATDAQKSML